TPPWATPAPSITFDIPGISGKLNTPRVVLYQHAMTTVYEPHESRVQSFTDGSTCEKRPTTAAVFPTRHFIIKQKLSRQTSSTVSELITIREAVRHIEDQEPQSWTVFTDSNVALETS
ncbi:hypothetical protein HPB47_001524, partial [Ixodes persulcatus]